MYSDSNKEKKKKIFLIDVDGVGKGGRKTKERRDEKGGRSIGIKYCVC
jgi:hypothetical protein